MTRDFNLPPGITQRDVDQDERVDRAELELERADRLRDAEQDLNND